VPFIRHSRDKRGYETTYVMHAYRPVHGPQRTRVLYLFRSPSHINMGRHPLDEEIREALEHTHPDVSFDWSALGRESTNARADEPRERERAHRPERRPARRVDPPPPAPVPVVLDDQSVLGRTLGAERAAEMRRQYGDLLQRIARRSRTPEDRDRLTQAAQRLNPDDWPDETEVRALSAGVQAEWDALAEQLPSRRRGRRGGRRPDRPLFAAGSEGPSAETHSEDDRNEGAEAGRASGIMAGGGDRDINANTTAMPGLDLGADAGRDHGRGPAETGPGADPEADSADQSAAEHLPDDN